jgi:glycosyltransferase involved in cell wall biosynthesis
VVGAGSLGERVRALAATIPGVEVAGHVDAGRLAAEYDRAAVVIVPSRYEGLGLVALEAQAHRAAVAGYDVDGLRDAVPQRDLLVPPGHLSALADRCIRLIDEPQYREDVAARGREFVRAEHSWDAMARRLEQVYADVVSGR